MNLPLTISRSLMFGFALALTFGLAPQARATVQVSATLIQTASGSPNSYSMTLSNNSTAGEAFNTFWFAWTPGQNYMASSPLTITAPAGWTFSITNGGVSDGYAIRFSTTGSLAAGSSLSGFSFQSTSSLSSLQGNSIFYPTTPVTTSEVFTTGGAAMVFTVQALNAGSDLGNYFLTKSISYTQTTASGAALQASQPYQLYANVYNGITGTILPTSTLTPPSGGTGTVTFTSNSGGSGGISFQQFFNTKTALDAAFPNGAAGAAGSAAYNLTIKTSTPNTYNEQLSFGADNYPLAPQITSVTNATWSGGNLVIADPTKPVTLTWPSFSSSFGGINLNFYSYNNSGGGFNQSFTANGSETSYTIPANTLTNNTLYGASLQFTNAGASGGTTFQVQVNFTVQAGTVDYGNYGFTKSVSYTQTSASAPMLNASQPYQIYGNINNGPNGSVLSTSTLTPPSGGTGTASFTSNSNGLFLQQQFNTKAALDAAYPDGATGATGSAAYTLTIKTSTPNTYTKQFTFGPDSYPVTPQITSVTNATWSGGNLVITDLTKPVTLTWPAFGTGSGAMAINFGISNNSGFNLSQFYNANGTQTSYTIPANTFANNSIYRGSLQFSNATAPAANTTFQNQVDFTIQVGIAATDLGFYNLQKGVNYLQTSSLAPVLDPKHPYQFYINVNPGETGSILPTSYLALAPGSTGMILFQSGSNGLQFNEDFSSKAALDAAFADGPYNLTVRTSTPHTYDTQLILPSDNYPPIPQVTITGGNGTWSGGNLVIDPTKPVTINWISYTSSNGNINFGINNANGIGTNGPADGTFNSYTIPANTLGANQSYQGYVSFNLNNPNSNPNPVPGAQGGGTVYQTQVNFNILTGTIPPSSQSLYFLQKSYTVVQNSNNVPTSVLGNFNDQPTPYGLRVESASGGTLTGPGAGSPYSLTYDSGSNNNPYQYNAGPFATRTGTEGLDTLYPDGTYTFNDTGGPALGTVSLTGDNYPLIPQVTAVNGQTPVWNPLGQLMLDPTVLNVITWTAFNSSNFSTNGHESVEIRSNNGGNDNVDLDTESGVISGGAAFSTYTIAANTLTSGHTYIGSIDYTQTSTFTSPATNVYEGAGYNTENDFTILATPPLTGTGNAQAIDFVPVGAQVYPGSPVTLIASTSSGLPVSFSVVSGPGMLSGNTLTFTGTGTVKVTASAVGNANYAAAPSVTQSIAVNPPIQNQTITFPTITAKTYGAAPFTISATASSGLPVSFSLVSGPATISGNTVTLTGAGTVLIQAGQAGNASYSAAPNTTQSFTVSKGAQTITFPSIGTLLFGGTATLNAAASSGLPVTYAVTGPATLTGNVLKSTGVGLVTVTASQGGNGNYLAATSVAQSVTVAKASQTISFPALASAIYGVKPLTISATATSGLSVSFSITSGPATISGSTLTITGAGTVTVKASQGGSTDYNAAPSVSQSFTVSPATQIITFPAISTQPAGSTLTLGATASSGLPVNYMVSGPATLSGFSLKLTGAGTVSVTAFQVGNSNYTAAPDIQQVFTVAPVAQKITFAAIGTQYFGAPFTLGATASSGLPVTYTITSGPGTVSGNVVTFTGVGTIDVQAIQTGNAVYSAATPVLHTISVKPGSQAITFPAIGNQLLGNTVSLNATASSGLPVSYTISGPAALSGTTLTVQGAGTVSITASQIGNGDYLAASNVQQSLTVFSSQQSQTITFPAIANTTVGSAPFALSATASSGLPITYSFSGPLKITGNVATVTGVGTVKIRASQTGNNTYSAATSVLNTFTVAIGSQTINFPAPAAQVYGAKLTLGATTASGLPITYSIISGPATLSGNVLTCTGIGTVTVQASQPGSANYTAAANVAQSFAVNPAPQTITFPVIPNQTLGTAPFTLNATSSSGLPITYAAFGAATVSGNTVTLTGTGPVRLTADQAGNADYLAAPTATVRFTVVAAP